MGKYLLTVAVLAGLAGGIILIRSANSSLDLGEAQNQENGKLSAASNLSAANKKIGGTKSSIPLDEIISGGPPKDGIPPIDEPKFISPTEASEWLTADDLGIAFKLNRISRFYPFKILVWHEIVNDEINGQRVLITYCPLCFTGIVFDPLVRGERVEFGTSGKLWNSNLLMYDRKTDSLWSQILGEAVVGEMTGAKLSVLPSDVAKFGPWRKNNPQGEVLSKDTGAVRIYGFDPYGDYYSSEDLLFPVANKDSRLGNKEFILGLVIAGRAKAYPVAAIKNLGEIEDKFAGKLIRIKYLPDQDLIRFFEQKDSGLVPINPIGSYWFAWIAAHPNSDLYSEKLNIN